MKITIIGAGSVGMLVASFLSESFHDISLIVRSNEQTIALHEHGLVRENLDGTISKTKVNIKSHLTPLSEDTLIIVAVKYNQLQNIYKILETQHKNIPILFLQNGLAHYEEALCLPQETILFGSCQFGAEKINQYTVAHRGIGVLKLAMGRGKEKILHTLSELKIQNFPTEYIENAEQMLFEKALLNCFINPLTTLLMVKNGELVENVHSLKLLEDLYNELMDAFPEERERFQFADVKKLCIQTASNTSSMLADRIHNRQTEVKTIVGAVIKKAQVRGKSLPILSTLYHLLLAVEESGEKM
ncbi:ketopantoate reductase family protein [Ureibacillus endophyticus]|uniref:2-dehydropantoate 2-reductase n=1 Tax=Ureibacillus endophyticus TaxID=1978490 RepID=A0A494ZC00_9BACL|nr:2-dehydropantoate 2-reductase [Lysinibacillus endophyticus]RKQ19698.1 2-dehydropantoate 2-reductase [Lysinibacillus endophyticus]